MFTYRKQQQKGFKEKAEHPNKAKSRSFHKKRWQRVTRLVLPVAQCSFLYVVPPARCFLDPAAINHADRLQRARSPHVFRGGDEDNDTFMLVGRKRELSVDFSK